MTTTTTFRDTRECPTYGNPCARTNDQHSRTPYRSHRGTSRAEEGPPEWSLRKARSLCSYVVKPCLHLQCNAMTVPSSPAMVGSRQAGPVIVGSGVEGLAQKEKPQAQPGRFTPWCVCVCGRGRAASPLPAQVPTGVTGGDGASSHSLVPRRPQLRPIARARASIPASGVRSVGQDVSGMVTCLLTSAACGTRSGYACLERVRTRAYNSR
jgi:hypothetical protein